MASNAETAYESVKGNVGLSNGTGDWFEVTQDLINKFADVTQDHQFIHVDPERAKDGPFGTTIAHGFLTLSMLVHLQGSLKGGEERPAPNFTGMVAGVNYGFDKIRFINPVKVNSKIRASSVTKDIELKGNAINMTNTLTIEIEGEDKPAVVADWITANGLHVTNETVTAEVARRLLGRVPELIESLGRIFSEDVPEYKALKEETLRLEVLPFTTTFVDRVFRTLANGESPDINDIPGIEDMGRRRLEMGISLEAMLHVFRIAGSVIFEGIVNEVRPGEEHAVGAIGAVWIDLIDHGSSRAATGYLQAARDQVRNVEARRGALLDALLAANDRAEVAAVAAEHSVALAREYTPVVASGDDLAVQLDRLVDAAPEGSLAAWRGRAVLLFLPTPASDRSTLATLLTDRAVVWGREAAVGTDLRAAVDQVERILALALERGLSGTFGPTDLVIERAMADSPRIAEELAQGVLQPLLDADRNGLVLSTLRTYFSTGSVAETAAIESAHPNTINYRLRRVAAITGYDPRVPVDASVLVLALSGAQIVQIHNPEP